MDASIIMDNASHELAAKSRLESFRMGGSPSNTSIPSLSSNAGHNRSHSRSHSRNMSTTSITSSLSTGVLNQSPALTSLSSDNTLATFSFPAMANPPPATSKRSSHHRRRSSVSTRTESAELMGVSLPELPPSNSGNNVNLGDKDSIRRRALWALEGKPDIPFPKVEIPEIGTPDLQKSSFDFRTCLSTENSGTSSHLYTPTAKASFPSGSSLALMLGNKRDSFKLLATSSSKDQLHTLVEEEEEEEGEEGEEGEEITQQAAGRGHENIAPPVADCEVTSEEQETDVLEAAVETSVFRPVPTRLRPVALNLRPLSLTPENLSSFQGLPTPTVTPQPLYGLKRLSLSSAPPKEDAQSDVASTPTPASRRPQLSLKLDNGNGEYVPSTAGDSRPHRRSSITYKPSSHGVATSSAGLPTPEMTPTFKDHRHSVTDSVRNGKSDEFFPGGSENRSLSASEQHFLVKSHNALLARITDLERALTKRRRVSSGYARSDFGGSRPTSMLSDTSDTSSEPSDEMLRLVADLKAERDELKRDVDGWRTRVGDMEKQTIMLTKRLENERRDAWLARSQARLLEVEKEGLEKKLEEVEKIVEELNAQSQTLTIARVDLARENEEIKLKVQELEEQHKITKIELQKERDFRKLQDDEYLATPIIRPSSSRPKSSHGRSAGASFASLDSLESSTTEVEIESADDCEARFSFMLKAVREEEESLELDSEDDSGLAGYEDEDDSDASFRSSSSFDSTDDPAEAPVQPATPSTPKPRIVTFSPLLPSDTQRPTHQSTGSWSKSWTFPRALNPLTTQKHDKKDPIDHFFGCVDDGSSSEGGSVPCSPSQYSFEKSKSLFVNALKEASEDDSPFFPQRAGWVDEDKCLDVVLEEEEGNEETAEETESDEEMFGEMGGITITLSPPQPEDDEPIVDPPQLVTSRPVEMPPQLPMLNFGDDDDDTGFSFGRTLEGSHSDKTDGEDEPAIVVFPPSAAIEISPIITVCLPAVTQTPPSPTPRARSALPSTIPRFSVTKPAAPTEPLKATPPSTADVHVTPPLKRGGSTLSFIPQAVSSPSPIRIAPISDKNRLAGTSTFIRQPQKKHPMSASDGNMFKSGTSSNGSNPTSQIAILNLAVNQSDSLTRFSESERMYEYKRCQQTQRMKTTNLAQSHPTSDEERDLPRQHENVMNHSPALKLASIITSPITTKLSSLSTFMHFSWGATTHVAPITMCFAPSASGSSMGSLPLDPHPDNQVALHHQLSQPQPHREFISRRQQLKKLRERMETEGLWRMNCITDPRCKNCLNETITL